MIIAKVYLNTMTVTLSAMSWPAWNMSAALCVQADLQTPSMRKGAPLALCWRTVATKSGT
jgi:hypothetical protein